MKLDRILDYAPEKLMDKPYICGIDEVGRGCGAGPVVTAAVVLPKDFESKLLRDSKGLTPKQKQEAYDLIMENALAISCKMGSVNSINELGINPATFNIMDKNITQIKVILQQKNLELDAVLVDGSHWPNETEVELVVKGDDTYRCIAAASIIAKVRRDRLMTELHEEFPNYGWNTNFGYLSPAHIKGIKDFGATEHHRNQYVRNFI